MSRKAAVGSRPEKAARTPRLILTLLTAGVDVNRTLINPIAASRGFTSKLLK